MTLLDRTAARRAEVGGVEVRRLLPRRARRTVGAWCFIDHFGPASTPPGPLMDVGPHPHCGLHTVTWLLEGEVVHRDSLGSEQVIRPGQVNLMTAGNGVSHSEETATSFTGTQHGVQLWMAQPEATRHGDADFQHIDALPEVAFGPWASLVLVGGVEGTTSPARADTPLIGLTARATRSGSGAIPLDPAFEHALVVVEGSAAVGVGAERVEPGEMIYLPPGREALELACGADAHVVLVGGEPFPDPIMMWWNFVARTRDEVVAATDEWNGDDGRFGSVDSALPVIPAPPSVPNLRASGG